MTSANKKNNFGNGTRIKKIELVRCLKNLIGIITVTFLIFSFCKVSYTKEIPVVVIAPNKKPQSLSTVGTSVTILDEEYLNKSNEYFLGDVLSSNTTSINFFQSGGHGTASAIQLRGMPKDILQFTLME